MISLYGYGNCSTCRKATNALRAAGVAFTEIDITREPPSAEMLRQIVASGTVELKGLFNRSGQAYRALNMKEKILRLNEAELLDLLAGNGRLIKRPIATDGRRHTVGYDETAFAATWT